MERKNFIPLIEDIISNPDNYFKVKSTSAGQCHINFSFFSFKTNNPELFDFLKNYFSTKNINFYNILDKGEYYSFWEKAEKISDSSSFLNRLKKRSQRHFLIHMINAADESCIINPVEKNHYLNQIDEHFTPKNPINWIAKKAKSILK